MLLVACNLEYGPHNRILMFIQIGNIQSWFYCLSAEAVLDFIDTELSTITVFYPFWYLVSITLTLLLTAQCERILIAPISRTLFF